MALLLALPALAFCFLLARRQISWLDLGAWTGTTADDGSLDCVPFFASLCL